MQTNFQELPAVDCHPGKINQVFYNILLNAIQASGHDGSIEVRTRPDADNGVLVEIEDHGGGISPEHLPHIFEPFFTTKPVGGGTGLGLSVSYGIVRDHGGALEVETAVGRGSLFRARFPLHAPRTVIGQSRHRQRDRDSKNGDLTQSRWASPRCGSTTLRLRLFLFGVERFSFFRRSAVEIARARSS